MALKIIIDLMSINRYVGVDETSGLPSNGSTFYYRINAADATTQTALVQIISNSGILGTASDSTSEIEVLYDPVTGEALPAEEQPTPPLIQYTSTTSYEDLYGSMSIDDDVLSSLKDPVAIGQYIGEQIAADLASQYQLSIAPNEIFVAGWNNAFLDWYGNDGVVMASSSIAWSVRGGVVASDGSIWTVSNTEANSGTSARIIKYNAAGANPVYYGSYSTSTPVVGQAPVFRAPSGLHHDGTHVYVTDQTANRIVKITASTGLVAQVITWTGANAPADICEDSTGALWVADSGANRIVKLSKTGSLQASLGGFSSPRGITFSGGTNGALWIADYNNDRISKVNPAGPTLVGSLGGGGTDDPYDFNGPMKLKFDASGALWVLDYGNQRTKYYRSGALTSYLLSPTTWVADANPLPSVIFSAMAIQTERSLYYPDAVVPLNNGAAWIGGLYTMSQFGYGRSGFKVVSEPMYGLMLQDSDVSIGASRIMNVRSTANTVLVRSRHMITSSSQFNELDLDVNPNLGVTTMSATGSISSSTISTGAISASSVSTTGTMYAAGGLACANGLIIYSGGVSVTGTLTANNALSVNGAASFKATPTSEASYQADVLASAANSAVRATASGTLTLNTSDARLKRDVADSPYGLDAVLALRPVTFHWNDAVEMGTRRNLGLLAQEVEPIVPEIVGTIQLDGMKTLDYEKLVAVLINAIKELNARVEALERQ